MQMFGTTPNLSQLQESDLVDRDGTRHLSVFLQTIWGDYSFFFFFVQIGTFLRVKGALLIIALGKQVCNRDDRETRAYIHSTYCHK